jgi:hypothetical protein
MIQILDKLRRSKISRIGGRNLEKEAIAGETKMRGREGEKTDVSAREPRGAFAYHR